MVCIGGRQRGLDVPIITRKPPDCLPSKCRIGTLSLMGDSQSMQPVVLRAERSQRIPAARKDEGDAS